MSRRCFWYQFIVYSFIDNIKASKEDFKQKMDDIRYTFIDELKEFYSNEANGLNILQCTINDDESMVRIRNSITSISSMESKIKSEDKPLLYPIQIFEEEKKQNEKLTVSYNIGDISIDSEDYKDGAPLESESHEETKEDEQGKSKDDSSNMDQRRVLEFSSAKAGDLSPSSFDDSLLEFRVEKEEKFGTNAPRSTKETYKITNISTKQSKL